MSKSTTAAEAAEENEMSKKEIGTIATGYANSKAVVIGTLVRIGRPDPDPDTNCEIQDGEIQKDDGDVVDVFRRGRSDIDVWGSWQVL